MACPYAPCKPLLYLILTFAIGAPIATPVSAEIHQVPSQFSSIQGAIQNSGNGDTVLIADGLYLEKIDFGGREITVASHYLLDQDPEHIELTIIDADSGAVSPATRGAVVTFENDEGASAQLIGLTVTGGIGNDDLMFGRKGGGICIVDAGPTIRHCVIRDNFASNAGGGVYCHGAPAPIFESCRFIDNNAFFFGGGMEIYICSPVVANCEFLANQTSSMGVGGGLDIWQGNVSVEGCRFADNSAFAGGALVATNAIARIQNTLFANNEAAFGGAVYGYGGPPSVIGCTFFGNTGRRMGGGVYLEACNMTFERCIIAFSPEGAAITELFSNISLSCCDLYGNAGGDWVGSIEPLQALNHNQWTDPLFCDALNDDFTLDLLSTCLPANNPCAARIGALGAGCQGTLKMQFSPHPLNVIQTHAVDSLMATIVVGNFTGGFALTDLDLETIRINDSLIPDSIYSLPAYENFVGEVLVLRESIASLLASFPVVWDTVLAEYRVTALFNNKSDLDLTATVPILGRISGDFNLDGVVDIADLIGLVEYCFNGGEAPANPAAIDMNHDGVLDILDLLALVERLFSEPPLPPGPRLN